MATQKLLISFLLFSLLAGHKADHGSSDHHQQAQKAVHGSSDDHHQQHQHDAHSLDYPEGPLYPLKPTKLFVFGDSYADTGNLDKAEGRSWKVPYGKTFPGCPAGRFSDGLIFTDFLGR
ncbi:hypothetical protein BT93_H3457 [Corymbia citriodora subsp. variegata]|nr:hypothetical protein BT93_H3457 [Corymbia citriodora subsp. variegata]